MAAGAARQARWFLRLRSDGAAVDVEVLSAVDLRQGQGSLAAERQPVRAGWGGLTPAMAASACGRRPGVLGDGDAADALAFQRPL